jgi:hypothetical protein
MTKHIFASLLLSASLFCGQAMAAETVASSGEVHNKVETKASSVPVGGCSVVHQVDSNLGSDTISSKVELCRDAQGQAFTRVTVDQAKRAYATPTD